MSRKTDRFFDLPIYLLIRFFLFLLGISSLFRQKLLPEILVLAFKRHRKYNRIVRKNIEMTNIISDPSEINPFVDKLYKNIAVTALETIEYMNKQPEDVDIDFIFEDHELMYRLKEKTCIYMTAHIGNFELFASFFRRYGIKNNIIARKMDNPYLDKMTRNNREKYGNRVIYQEGSIYYIGNGFQHKENCFLLADHRAPREYGVWVNFFGLPAITLTIPAYFALKMDVSIVPVFCIKEKNSYRIIVIENVPVIREYSKSYNIWANTQRYTQIIEQIIRRYPDQWLWSYERWRIKPTEQELETCNQNYYKFIQEGLSYKL